MSGIICRDGQLVMRQFLAMRIMATYHRVSKGPKRVLGFGRRQKLSCRSHFFLSGHIYPITQEFA